MRGGEEGGEEKKLKGEMLGDCFVVVKSECRRRGLHRRRRVPIEVERKRKEGRVESEYGSADEEEMGALRAWGLDICKNERR